MRIPRAHRTIILLAACIGLSCQPITAFADDPTPQNLGQFLDTDSLSAPNLDARAAAQMPIAGKRLFTVVQHGDDSKPPVAVEPVPVPKPGVLGKEPTPTAADNRRLNALVQDLVDPQHTLDLIIGRPRLMRLKAIPTQTQMGDPNVAALTQLTDGRHLSILGSRIGTTSMYLWFPDPNNEGEEVIISFLVRVLPDPEEKSRREQVYEQLGEEINALFPDSHVEVKLVGDKIVVRGQAHDIHEGTQIIQIVRANLSEDDDIDDDDPSDIPVGVGPIVVPSNLSADQQSPSVEDFVAAGGPNVINLLRIPGVQQVSLKVTVAEINRAAARSIGLNFAIDNDAGVTVFENRTGNIATGGNASVIGGIQNDLAGLLTNNLPVNLDGGQVRLAINALRSMDYAKSLAEPNLVAINGQTASFQAGGQFPVPVIASNGVGGLGNLQGVSFIPFGVLLNFTPYVTDRDRIRLNVAAEVSVRDLQNGTQINGGAVAGLNTRNFQSTVELRDGQTLAVAGLLQNNSGTRSSRVPLLGDLPIAGRMFGFDQIQSGEQELVVLVTPQLVSPLDGCERPPLPGSDVYEPGDCEFYLLGRLESRRETDYRSPVRTDWHRMKAYHHCEETYIAGPHGHECGPEQHAAGGYNVPGGYIESGYSAPTLTDQPYLETTEIVPTPIEPAEAPEQ